MMTRQLPSRTREALAACEAVGLMFWANHPWPGMSGRSMTTGALMWSGSAAAITCPARVSGIIRGRAMRRLYRLDGEVADHDDYLPDQLNVKGRPDISGGPFSLPD